MAVSRKAALLALAPPEALGYLLLVCDEHAHWDSTSASRQDPDTHHYFIFRDALAHVRGGDGRPPLDVVYRIRDAAGMSEDRFTSDKEQALLIQRSMDAVPKSGEITIKMFKSEEET